MPDGPCFYCLEKHVSVAICLSCRSKYDMMKRDLEYWKRQAAWQRRSFFNVEKENRRLREELAKKGKR
jgi:hypothetical protein